MTGSVLSTGDGHQGWQDKLSIMMVLELSICLKTGAMTLKTVLDKGYGSIRDPQIAGRGPRVAGRIQPSAISRQQRFAVCGLRPAAGSPLP